VLYHIQEVLGFGKVNVFSDKFTQGGGTLGHPCSCNVAAAGCGIQKYAAAGVNGELMLKGALMSI
jgi:hypothetical protein